MGVAVRFWGTRGSIPTPGNLTKRYGGNTSCVEIRFDDTLFICDAGSGIRELGIDLLRRSKTPVSAHLLISHTHWDHLQGFPFFAPVYSPATQLRVYDRAPGDERFFRLLSGQMSTEYFPIRFSDLRAKVTSDHLNNGDVMIEGIRIRFIEQAHPGGSLGFSFENRGKKIIYATDNEVDKFLVRDDDARKTGGLRRIDPAQVEFIRDADLLIADGQYSEAEYLTHVGWGHPSVITLVDYAVQAGVRLLCITHHDPGRSDTAVDELIQSCRDRAAQHKSELKIFPAREGVELMF